VRYLIWLLAAALLVGCPTGNDDDSAVADDDDTVADDDDATSDDDDATSDDDDATSDDDDATGDDDDSATADDDDATSDDDDATSDDDDATSDDDDATADDDDAVSGDDDDSATGDDDDSATSDDDDSSTACPDADGDGVTLCGADGLPGTADDDCDDSDPTIAPGVMELCDELDTNCDGALAPAEIDVDGDGVPQCLGDCSPSDPAISPLAAELCDGQDNDCDGTLLAEESDVDGDSVLGCGPDGVLGSADDDCDDNNATVYPSFPEQCDGVDNDCDGSLGVDELDGDGDGTTVCDGDCDGADATTYPGAPEVCDGQDNDCDGSLGADELDGDGDGVTPCGPDLTLSTSDDDCDDTEPTVYPGAAEVCDGLDNDCDGTVPANEVDGDGDGSPLCADCDDADPTQSPLIVEGCGGADVNCDGVPPPPCTSCAVGPFTAAGDLCDATDWAITLLELSDCSQDQQDFVSELNGLASCGCPTSTTSSVTNSVSWDCGLNPWGVEMIDTEVWGPGCSGGTASGSLTFVEEYTDCPGGSANYYYVYDDDLTGSGFEVTPPPGCGTTSLTELAMDGIWDRLLWFHANLPPGTVNSCTIDAEFTVEGALASPTLSEWLLTGTSDIERSRSLNCINGSQGGQSPGTICNGAADITATAHMTTTPWVVTTNLDWFYDDGGGFWTFGCQDEPVSGSILVEVYDAPGGIVLSSLELAFNGNTICDGCADVTLDGVPSGTWCSPMWGL